MAENDDEAPDRKRDRVEDQRCSMGGEEEIDAADDDDVGRRDVAAALSRRARWGVRRLVARRKKFATAVRRCRRVREVRPVRIDIVRDNAGAGVGSMPKRARSM